MIALQFLLDLIFVAILWFLFARVQAMTPEEEFRSFITRPLLRAFALANLLGALFYLQNHNYIRLWLHWIVMGLLSAVLFHLFYKHVFKNRFAIPAFVAAYTFIHWFIVLSIIKIKVYGESIYHEAALIAYFLQSLCIIIVWKYSYRYFSQRRYENLNNGH